MRARWGWGCGLLVATCVAGALAGCGSSSGGGPSQAQISAAAAAQPAAPGSSLAIGTPATVTYLPPAFSGRPSHKVRIVVQSVKQGPVSDLQGLQLDADQKGAAPEYVKVLITDLGPGSISDNEDNDLLPGTLMGIDHTGNQQEPLTFIVGDFAPCDDKDVPDPLKQGQTYATCLTFVVPHGITKVAYTGTQAYVESPVTWKVS